MTTRFAEEDARGIFFMLLADRNLVATEGISKQVGGVQHGHEGFFPYRLHSFIHKVSVDLLKL